MISAVLSRVFFLETSGQDFFCTSPRNFPCIESILYDIMGLSLEKRMV